MAEQHNGIERLLAIMARLRDPEHGCPWDVAQDFASVAPYTIEEAYEVADAIDRGDFEDLRDELGDLLLQVVFHAQMAQEQGRFDFSDVAAAICDKMERRHPHVFGDVSITDVDAQTLAWEQHKRAEREASSDDHSALAGIARGLPEWQRATKLQKRAATVGFDWPDVEPVLAKLHEEIDEVRAEFAKGIGHDALEDEIGDVLFVCVNLARHGKVDFGNALRCANAKFERRFRRMEVLAAADGVALADLDLAQQDAYWDRAKAEEKPRQGNSG
ncbi:MAG: nucleoside triphosphate pyrophosphohydrolase [Xanthomonadaceae bacterium]|nr:nucleoside triphosphate pyrophosphohydrolase [Xanthomonadaceae bacterium]MDP2184390.1 nucleoside triphosphate pyrophosphohydrolase [Xanthomonadales bacterium]MDZ4115430.1 nucleoside triphosphate pyrophosphohydrolase [Xanthomonadaceae bacterium]MDZ4377514.1 nucleoside triphosphate pyrophosphohydrolase [Xanthomonadaceae bacterium]